MKVALVHDDLIQFGGAEKVILALHELFPDAPLYTSFASQSFRDVCAREKIDLRVSFVQKLPLISKWYRFYGSTLVFQLAFETFDFSEYDVVISNSTRFAHTVITKPKTLHISYIHSPGRMFWESHDYFEGLSQSFFVKKILIPLSRAPLSYMRLSDFASAQRVDKIISNSQNVAQKVQKYYKKASTVIYPFCDTETFEQTGERKQNLEPYFLVLSRLNPWKKIDYVISAFNQEGKKLLIAGTGPDEQRLKKLAGPNVKFLGFVSEDKKRELLANCEALIFPQAEDFGITPLEAMASGKPVIAFGSGGALETIVQGKTGEFYFEQNEDSLSKVLTIFDGARYNSQDCRDRAKTFDKKVFLDTFRKFVDEAYVQGR